MITKLPEISTFAFMETSLDKVVFPSTSNVEFKIVEPPTVIDELNETSSVTCKSPEISRVNFASLEDISPTAVLLSTLLSTVYTVLILSTVVSVTITLPLFTDIALLLPDSLIV